MRSIILDSKDRAELEKFDKRRKEFVISLWKRAKSCSNQIRKGLSKDENAQILDSKHWPEAIDPLHRYGHNLHMYYDIWLESESNQPFFCWLDFGDGKEVNLEKCPRTVLQHQRVIYLRPKEREAYEVVVENGKLVYKQSRIFVDTLNGSKWIFVLGPSRNLYVGEKKKGRFHHSSFLAGGATISSGRLVARNGILLSIWPHSGHYRPTKESFMEFCSFLADHHVDLTNVKKSSTADDIPQKVTDKDLKLEEPGVLESGKSLSHK